jgi:hypothetical protein
VDGHDYMAEGIPWQHILRSRRYKTTLGAAAATILRRLASGVDLYPASQPGCRTSRLLRRICGATISQSTARDAETAIRAQVDPIHVDPQFSWHGGFGWWHGKFARLIGRLAEGWNVSFAEARARMGSKLAVIELVPYHSSVFHDRGWIRELHSVALARAFVRDRVIPRVRHGEAIAIVTRQASTWNLPDHSRVIKYNGQQARAAHLTPDSPGGSAILKLLLR